MFLHVPRDACDRRRAADRHLEAPIVCVLVAKLERRVDHEVVHYYATHYHYLPRLHKLTIIARDLFNRRKAEHVRVDTALLVHGNVLE